MIAYQYGGGAGFENPLLRDPEAVRQDVLDEYVSVEAARERYGVVLTGSAEAYDLAVDDAATAALRAQLATLKRQVRRAAPDAADRVLLVGVGQLVPTCGGSVVGWCKEGEWTC